MKRKTIFDDGFQDYLVENATFVGNDGIPCLEKLDNTSIPSRLVPFNKANSVAVKSGYVHFYIHDIQFRRILTSTKKYLNLLGRFDGVISPDPTITIGNPRCLNVFSTYMNRAVGVFLQQNGIPVIPNVRWGDEETYEYAFAGIPKNTIVCISTHGAIRRDLCDGNLLRNTFRKGLEVMLKTLEPKTILVHGHMPTDIFGEYQTNYKFIRYPSEFESSRKEVSKDGNNNKQKEEKIS